MKKNKTIAYLMAATLLVGGTFLGTKALFTDQTTAHAELTISTGDLDIEVVESGEWKLERNGNEFRDGSKGIKDSSNLNDFIIGGEEVNENPNNIKGAFANNLKPGDVLTKTVKIQNKGTLIADVNLEEVKNDGLANGLLTLDTKGLSKTTLNPQEEATFELRIEVNNVGGKHGEGFNTNDQENAVINIDDLVKGGWKLEATQQNTNLK